MPNPQAPTLTIAPGQVITKKLIGKDAGLIIGPASPSQLNGAVGTGTTCAYDAATQIITYAGQTGTYGSATFTFKATNALAQNLYIDQTVNNPAPFIFTSLEIVEP